MTEPEDFADISRGKPTDDRYTRFGPDFDMECWDSSRKKTYWWCPRTGKSYWQLPRHGPPMQILP